MERTVSSISPAAEYPAAPILAPLKKKKVEIVISVLAS